MSNGILIWAEITPQKYINTVFYELASKAVELQKGLPDSIVEALIFTDNELSEAYKESFRNSGFDKVYYVVDEKFGAYKTDLYVKAAIEAVKKISPNIMLIGATTQGRDLAPRISTALHTGLTADCTALDIIEGEKLAATRPTFGGQLMATVLSKNSPQMATVRPKVFKPQNDNQFYKNTDFIQLDVDVKNFNSKIEILEFKEKIQNEINSIDSAEIIVAGGRGMQSKEGFNLLQQLADKIGGVVGASRLAVEMGFAPAENQIGQTGKTVSPKLYIACGISGALQHTIGMNKSDKIIAINKDKDAPIFEIADYGYVGDVFDILPKLIEKL